MSKACNLVETIGYCLYRVSGQAIKHNDFIAIECRYIQVSIWAKNHARIRSIYSGCEYLMLDTVFAILAPGLSIIRSHE